MPRHLDLIESCASCLPHGNYASSVDSIILPQMLDRCYTEQYHNILRYTRRPKMTAYT